jgi:hypothetical protein
MTYFAEYKALKYMRIIRLIKVSTNGVRSGNLGGESGRKLGLIWFRPTDAVLRLDYFFSSNWKEASPDSNGGFILEIRHYWLLISIDW